MKRPKIKGQRHGWAVVHFDGSVAWNDIVYASRFDALGHAFSWEGATVVKVVVPTKKRKTRRARGGRR